jgi:integrase
MGLRKKSNRWYYRFRSNGKQYEGSTGLAATRRNENAAKDFESKARLAIEAGKIKKPSYEITFDYAAQEFLDWCKIEYHDHPNSAKRICGSFSSLNEFFKDRPLSTIGHGDVERYKVMRVNEQHIKNVTLRNDLNALSLFFGYCIRVEWCSTNVLKGENKVKRPSGEDAIRMHILTANEECVYFEACGRRRNIHDLAKLMLLQGCRPDEILALEKGAYDPKRGTIRIVRGKTKAAKRVLTLCGESIEILDRRTREGDTQWLFPSRHKPGHHIQQMDHTHTSVLEDSGLPWFVLYDFRHTFATRMVQDANIDMPSLASILGHSGLRAVMKYVHPTAEHQREAMKKYDATRPRRLEIASKTK